MRKLLNLKTAFIVIAVSFATFSGVKGYQYVANLSGISAFLLENVEALAQGEGSGTLTLWCQANSNRYAKCYYRCPSCNTMVETVSSFSQQIAVTGVCRCGHPAN